MSFDNFPHRRESEPGSAAFRREKRLENPLNRRVVDTAPGIDQVDRRFGAAESRSHPNLTAPLRRRLRRVEQQIQNRAVERTFVDANRRRVARIKFQNFDAERVRLRSEKLDDFLQFPIRIGRRQFEPMRASKVKELVEQIFKFLFFYMPFTVTQTLL